VLGVSKSGYYAWLAAPESRRAVENRELLQQIMQIHEESDRRYGSPKILDRLKKRGYMCGHNRLARIMRENGIKSKVVKKIRPRGKVIDKNHAAPNTLDRRFQWDTLNQAWATDITYIPTKNGWVYLCVFLDLCSRAIVGWSVAEHMRTELVMDALRRAYASRRPGKGLLIHSDQGSQFGSDDFYDYLREYEFEQSMSRRGNCWDNACVESFFRLLKVEELNDYCFNNVEEVRFKVFGYIEYFYNRQRIHSRLGYMSPLEFEKNYVLNPLSKKKGKVQITKFLPPLTSSIIHHPFVSSVSSVVDQWQSRPVPCYNSPLRGSGGC